MMLVFRALSALLSYPTEHVRQALPEIAEVVRTTPLLALRERQNLLNLIDGLGHGELKQPYKQKLANLRRMSKIAVNVLELQ